MLSNFLATPPSGQSLSAFLDITPQGLGDYMASAPFQAAKSDLDNGVYSAPATATLYQEVKLAVIESYKDWTAVLLKLGDPPPVISSTPSNSFLVALDLPHSLSLELYDVSGFPSPGDVPGSMSLSKAETVVITNGSALDLTAGAKAWFMAGTVAGSTFLRFIGPPVEAISATFDRMTLEFRSISYSTAETTGQAFFTKFVERFLNETGKASVNFPESAMCLDFLEKRLGEEEVEPFTRWKIIQLLGRYRPNAALPLLRQLRDAGPPHLSEHAGRALSKLA